MPEPSGDARRTSLANERTQLAWWRTGLTALAVALAAGKLIPDLGDRTTPAASSPRRRLRPSPRSRLWAYFSVCSRQALVIIG